MMARAVTHGPLGESSLVGTSAGADGAAAARIAAEVVELRRLAAVVDSSADAILSKDREGRITSWNRGAESLYGYAASEIVGQLVSVLVPGDRAGEEHAILDRLLRDEDVARYDTQRLAKDGSVIDVSITVSPICGTSGEVIGASSIHRDITEQRRASEQLRLRAELLDLAHDAVIVRDPAQSRVTFWNREAQDIYGYSAAEALGQVTHDLLATVFPESREAVDDALARDGRWVGELSHTRKDGDLIVVSSRQALQRGADRRPIAIIELNSDITERKRAEEQLARISGVLERTERISRTGGWEYDVATGELTWTDEVYSIYGVDRTSDPTVVTEAIAAYDPESATILDAAFKRLVAEGEPYDLELGLIRAGGQRIWVRTVGRPMIEDGRVVRVGGHISDVSERKRVEQALRASDQLFHSGFDHSPSGMALTGLDGRLVEVNAAFAGMLGYDDPAQMAGQDFARFTHPDDVAASREGIRMMVQEGKPFVAEKRYIRSDVAVVYGLVGSTAVLDADGRPSMLYTQIQDITQRKQRVRAVWSDAGARRGRATVRAVCAGGGHHRAPARRGGDPHAQRRA
jgi:PAS domain S-box-containing protein